MPYSLHEKSGLVSVVIEPDHILDFDKKEAEPKAATFTRAFLDVKTCVPGDAGQLAALAWRWQAKVDERRPGRGGRVGADGQPLGPSEFDDVTEMVPESHFPPCMRNALEGMKDGKKRAMFALTNFFTVCGWAPDAIEERLHEWNRRNAQMGEPLREVVIKGTCAPCA